MAKAPSRLPVGYVLVRLEEGQRVEFSVTQGQKGPAAEDVVVLQADD